MKLTRKKLIAFFLILNLSVLGIALIYNLLFKENLIGQCAFLKVFGFYCPGCGGSRSLNALLKLDLIRSFIYYPPILITSLILLYADIRLLISIIQGGEIVKGINYRIFLIIPIAIILNFIVRNILLLFGIDLLGNIL